MPPPSPMTPCANACPRPMLPRGFGRRHAYPADASSTAFGSESEKNAPQFHVGPPCTHTIIGSGPSAPRRRHQHTLDLDAVVGRGPPDRPGVGEDGVRHDRVVERRAPQPRSARRVEPRELGRPAVRLVRRPDGGGILA